MKTKHIRFDEKSSATYSGFKETAKTKVKHPSKLTKRELLLQNISDAAEWADELKNESNPSKQGDLVYAKEKLDLAKRHLELHDAGLNEYDAAQESYYVSYVTWILNSLKTTTGLGLVAKALIEAANRKQP